MTKSELINKMAARLKTKHAERAVNCIIDTMVNELASGGRVEVRGFGSFSLRHYQARTGRNPRTGEEVSIPPKNSVRFKVGLDLSKRVREPK